MRVRFGAITMAGWLSKLTRKSTPKLDVARATKTDAEDAPKPLFRAERLNSFMEVYVITEFGYKRQGVALDVSDSGARLRFHTSESMPSRIRLKIPKLKVDCLADVVWHKGVDVGVRFA